METQNVLPHTTESREGRERAKPKLSVCMHVLGMGRIDGRVMRAARAVTNAGYPVTIVDIEHDTSRPSTERIDDIDFKHSFMSQKWSRYYQPVAFLPWMMFKVLRIVRGILLVVRTPADVYHAHDVVALPACYIAAVLRRKRLVYDAHELPLVDPQHTRHRVVWRVSTALLRRIMPRCDAIITVSPQLIPELQERYGGPTAYLVRNIPPYQSPPLSTRLRDHIGANPNTKIALYQGNLQDDRDLDILVRAARYLAPDHQIVFMGRDLTQGHLAGLIEEEGVGDRVTILPPVASSELLQWTASADLGLIVYRPSYSPNVRYCLPNKVFEYLIAGVPVLASPLDAIAQLLHTYDVGTVLPSVEPTQVGAAINAFLGDGATLARMRQNAVLAARKELNWESEGDRLLEVYQDMSQPGRQRRGDTTALHDRHSDELLETH
jgi:glycosyltransferase involved in cell wall biosynthesis